MQQLQKWYSNRVMVVFPGAKLSDPTRLLLALSGQRSWPSAIWEGLSSRNALPHLGDLAIESFADLGSEPGQHLHLAIAEVGVAGQVAAGEVEGDAPLSAVLAARRHPCPVIAFGQVFPAETVVVADQEFIGFVLTAGGAHQDGEAAAVGRSEPEIVLAGIGFGDDEFDDQVCVGGVSFGLGGDSGGCCVGVEVDDELFGHGASLGRRCWRRSRHVVLWRASVGLGLSEVMQRD